MLERFRARATLRLPKPSASVSWPHVGRQRLHEAPQTTLYAVVQPAPGAHRHLWEQRFKSVLVEGAGDVVATMAAYIDLNPVRAKLVVDPQDYRWSGMGRRWLANAGPGKVCAW